MRTRVVFRCTVLFDAQDALTNMGPFEYAMQKISAPFGWLPKYKICKAIVAEQESDSYS